MAAQAVQEPGDECQPEEGEPFVNGHPQDEAFVPPQPGHPAGSEQLREEPAGAMDGGHQAEEDRRVCHPAEKKRDEGRKGAEAHPEAEERPVEQADSDVVAQVLAGFQFDLCGWHACYSTTAGLIAAWDRRKG